MVSSRLFRYGVPVALSASAACLVAVLLVVVASGSLVAVGLVGGVVAGAAGIGVALALARPSPLVLLVAVLALQVLQLGGGRGLQVGEVLGGLALVGYLGWWYPTTWGSGRRVVTSMFDAAALAWGTVGLAAAAVIGLLYGADPYDFRADLLATLPFLLYLPVKDAVARHPHGALAIGGALVALGLAATVESALLLRQTIQDATMAWQIADARPVVNEASIVSGVLMTFAGVLSARDRRVRWLLLAVAGALLGGLVLSKSRGFWIATVLGVLALGAESRPAQRRRLVGGLVTGTVVLGVGGVVLLSDQIALVLDGSLNRLASIATAGRGVSIVNRFAETRAAWDMIKANPVLGYGWGVQVSYYSLISEGTTRWAYLHNGYVALWLKTGLWGLGLMLWVWLGAAVRGALASHERRLGGAARAGALGAMATVVALSLVAVTSNPFSSLDLMLVVVLNVALAHGVADRAVALRGARGHAGAAHAS